MQQVATPNNTTNFDVIGIAIIETNIYLLDTCRLIIVSHSGGSASRRDRQVF